MTPLHDSLFWMPLIVGLFLLFLAYLSLRAGYVSFGQPGKGARRYRSREPIVFWIITSITILIAVISLMLAGSHLFR